MRATYRAFSGGLCFSFRLRAGRERRCARRRCLFERAKRHEKRVQGAAAPWITPPGKPLGMEAIPAGVTKQDTPCPRFVLPPVAHIQLHPAHDKRLVRVVLRDFRQNAPGEFQKGDRSPPFRSVKGGVC